LADAPATPPVLPKPNAAWSGEGASRQDASISLRALWVVLARRKRFAASVIAGFATACLLYCLIAPKQYEASARVALRTSPNAAVQLDGTNEGTSRTLISADTQLETMADIFRSDQLAWRVVKSEKLYVARAFAGTFVRRYPGFHVEEPASDAQAYLLERFQKRLNVRTLPGTLIVQIRFRSNDAALSAAVVNALIEAYRAQDAETRVQATAVATGLLRGQLSALKGDVDRDNEKLITFQNEHGLVDALGTGANDESRAGQHNAVLLEIDDLGRELVAATANRIRCEAEYKAAMEGNPELVFATDEGFQAQNGGPAGGLLRQLHARQSSLEEEESQLQTEHGPNFPRAVEIHAQLEDLDQQIRKTDTRLLEEFKDAFKTAVDRERMVQKSLDEKTGAGLQLNASAIQYAVMRAEVGRSEDLYLRVTEKVNEAGMAAGLQSANIVVVDAARPPAKSVAPDLAVYLALTLFVGGWVALAGALLLDSLSSTGVRAAMLGLLVLAGANIALQAQAPTPNTSGMPSGVAHLPQSIDSRSAPNAKDAPAIWRGATSIPLEAQGNAGTLAATMPAPIGPGDIVEVSEFHTPEFHRTARVSVEGTITLPLIGELAINGMDERSAALTIEGALVAHGMLLHPQVTVMVTAYAGLDVSVLGEVARPGVYSLSVHHRLLDLISAASGLAPSAGSLVMISHRGEEKTARAIALDPTGSDVNAEHNPDLAAGDTVQVSRAGLVFVIGDVMRPGGFPVDPVQRLTVVQALTLAWGPTQSASLNKALLIREQKGGRTITALNLKRLLRGQDPDLPIQDRDIIFVPDSTAKNLWNRTMESVVQSAAGVSIYAGMVYSQRF